MRRVSRAAWGSVLFFLVAPGVMGGVVPWLLSAGYDDPAGPTYVALGLALVVRRRGRRWSRASSSSCWRAGGRPAPVAPTQELVVGGIYRWVRNPMYLAVAAVIGGQALVFTSGALLVWLLIFLLAVVSFVLAYEQPTLRDTYGESYDAYRRAVPGWWPRLTPWRGPPTTRAVQHPVDDLGEQRVPEGPDVLAGAEVAGDVDALLLQGGDEAAVALHQAGSVLGAASTWMRRERRRRRRSPGA